MVQAAGGVPGVVALVTDRDGLRHAGVAGVRTLGVPVPMTLDTVLSAFSLTKAITGAALMQLVEAHRVTLDDPAGAYVPEIDAVRVLDGFDTDGTPRLRPPRRPITVRHLLLHVGGFGYPFFNHDLRRYREATRRNTTPDVAPDPHAHIRGPLLFDPGEQWRYSISIDWVGFMVEAASGMKLDRYMKEKIFAPLGMADTGFKITPAMRPRKAAVHVRKEGGGFTATDHELNQDPEVFQGGGALYSTVGDYLKFVRALLGGGAPILKPEAVALMYRNAMNDGVLCRPLKSYIPARSADMNFVDGMKWGLTFMINPRAFPGRRSADSLTWGGLANSYFWIDPARKVTGVWATQLLPFYDARAVEAFEEFERGVYGSL